MRIEVITKTFAKFQELSDIQKQKVIEKNRQINVDYDWFDYQIDEFKTMLEAIGFYDAQVYFTGFWSQGDGACFTGNYRYKKDCLDFVKNNAPEFYDYVKMLQEIQKNNFYSINCDIKSKSNYSHSGTMYFTKFGCRSYSESIENEVLDIFRSMADTLYNSLEKEYNYLTSDDAIAESLTANEFEFDLDNF